MNSKERVGNLLLSLCQVVKSDSLSDFTTRHRLEPCSKIKPLFFGGASFVAVALRRLAHRTHVGTVTVEALEIEQ